MPVPASVFPSLALFAVFPVPEVHSWATKVPSGQAVLLAILRVAGGPETDDALLEELMKAGRSMATCGW